MLKMKKLILELTNRCNAFCIMCSHHKMKRKEEDMRESDLYNIFSQVKADRVILHFFGEPLLYPNLELAIALAKMNRSKTVLTTNAELLTQNKLISISKCGLDELIMSFGAYRQETYNKIFYGLNYGKVRSNIITAYHIKKRFRLKTHLQIRLIETKENVNEIKDAKELYSQFCDILTITPEFHLYGYDRVPFQKRGNKCNVDNELVIKSNGDVVLCCFDLDGDYIMGNIRDEGVIDIWDDFRMKRRFTKYKLMAPPICKECGIRRW